MAYPATFSTKNITIHWSTNIRLICLLLAAAVIKGEKSTAWTQEEIQLLVKAVKLYPAGTVRRWEAIAVFINSHSSTSESKTSQQVISKVKILKKTGMYYPDQNGPFIDTYVT